MNTEQKKSVLLSYANLSDEYERKARFIPAVLTVCVLMPVALAFGIPLSAWLTFLLAGVGLAAVMAVGLSHLASALGNRLQRKLWPDWPHDSPTNSWLHPNDETRSKQQKQRWYAAIKRLTDLDIDAAKKKQVRAVINDAIAEVRARLSESEATRLRMHLADYGFARNVTGLRGIWLTGALLSCAGSWIAYVWFSSDLVWPIIATAILLAAVPLAFLVLPSYVRQKADYYAESFYAALLKLDETKGATPRAKQQA